MLKRFLLSALLLVAACDVSAYSYNGPLKDARQTAIATAIDSGGAAGRIEFGTAGMATVLCTITLNTSPAGTVSGGVLTLSGFPKVTTCTGTGTIVAARIRTSTSVDVVTGLTVTATGGGGNIPVTNPAVVPTQTLSIDHLTFTHP